VQGLLNLGKNVAAGTVSFLGIFNNIMGTFWNLPLQPRPKKKHKDYWDKSNKASWKLPLVLCAVVVFFCLIIKFFNL
jgi:hypothetical protein